MSAKPVIIAKRLQELGSRYRAFIDKWPKEENKPGRNIRDQLIKIYGPIFSQHDNSSVNSSITDADTKKILQTHNKSIDELEEEISAWERLADNTYAKKYPPPKNFKPVYKPAYDLLSTENREKIAKINPLTMLVPNMRAWFEYITDKSRKTK